MIKQKTGLKIVFCFLGILYIAIKISSPPLYESSLSFFYENQAEKKQANSEILSLFNSSHKENILISLFYSKSLRDLVIKNHSKENNISFIQTKKELSLKNLIRIKHNKNNLYTIIYKNKNKKIINKIINIYIEILEQQLEEKQISILNRPFIILDPLTEPKNKSTLITKTRDYFLWFFHLLLIYMIIQKSFIKNTKH